MSTPAAPSYVLAIVPTSQPGQVLFTARAPSDGPFSPTCSLQMDSELAAWLVRQCEEARESVVVLGAFVAAFDKMAFADRWPLEDIAARARAMMENTAQNQIG